MDTEKKISEKLEFIKIASLNQLGVIFNSDGKPLNKKELKPFINRDLNNKLNFAIGFAQENNYNYSELQEIKDLLMSQI